MDERLNLRVLPLRAIACQNDDNDNKTKKWTDGLIIIERKKCDKDLHTTTNVHYSRYTNTGLPCVQLSN